MIPEELIEQWVNTIEKRQQEINTYVITVIANRIREIGDIKWTDAYKLQMLLKSGADLRKIKKEIARLTSIQVRSIDAMLTNIARSAYMDTKELFEYRGKPFIPFEENKPLQRVVRAVAKQTANTYVNLSRSQAFMLRDLQNPKLLKPTPLSKAYQSVVDEAVQAAQSGVIDYHTAMRRTMTQLVDSGIQATEYHAESGRVTHQRLDTAVRRNVLDGVRAINQGVQDEVGKEFGADGKELTAHFCPAPDHEYIQGHQFTNEEYEKLQSDEDFHDVNGTRFRAIRRAIGTLNCRHFAFSIIVGFSTPAHTDEELRDIIKKNHEGYTDAKGKHRTMYECTQVQRRMELNVRKMKEGQIAARASGDAELARWYQAKVNKGTAQYNAFSKDCGLQPLPTKMTVKGYHKIAV